MRNNPVARALAIARNRRRIVPDKRREEVEAVQFHEAETALDERSSGEQIAQRVDDMVYGMIGIAIGSDEHREKRRGAYSVAKENLAVLLDAATAHSTPTNPTPKETLP